SDDFGQINAEAVVPSDGLEGWSCNKKYIERVSSGYMCMVCRKIYGRYNSVSYHITIYHRNRPIHCDKDGCQFSTRSRKCSFCKHISKSPAMLEKHLSRHMQECSRTSSEKQLLDIENLFTSNLCSYTCADTINLSIHYRKVHCKLQQLYL
ncbi:unnamed protein product, partial [Thelazia callipaeda]|uniref:C2H2-type domain-containing protein n=1 Tax=Thelazia callipaeda TaxID=103827 RepID=A0A0N5DC61_THECL